MELLIENEDDVTDYYIAAVSVEAFKHYCEHLKLLDNKSIQLLFSIIFGLPWFVIFSPRDLSILLEDLLLLSYKLKDKYREGNKYAYSHKLAQ